MKRGNTALKRVVSVASVAAMAIAGAVLAAPAASAAGSLTPTDIRATPIADVGLINTATSQLVTALGQTTAANYGAGTTGAVPILSVGSGQSASGFQLFLPAADNTGGATPAPTFDTTDSIEVDLSAAATFSGIPSVSITPTPVEFADLATNVGVNDTSKVLGVQRATAADAITSADLGSAPANLASGTIKASVDKGTLTLDFDKADTNPVAAGADASAFGYLITVSNVKVDIANTATYAPVTATVAGAPANTLTTIGYVSPFSISIGDGAGYPANTSNAKLPDIRVTESSKNAFDGGSNLVLTVSGDQADSGTPVAFTTSDLKITPTATLDVTAGAGNELKVAATGGATQAVDATGDPARIESFVISGLEVSGLKAGADVKVAITGPTGATVAAESGFSNSPAQVGDGDSVTISATTSVPRVAGNSRYATAGDIAAQYKDANNNAGNTVVLANGLNAKDGIDALAANFLAGAADAPILLADSSDKLPQATQDALKALFTDSIGDADGNVTIYVMGKTDSVSDEAAAQAKSIAEAAVNAVVSKVEVTRVAGDNRYETAAAAATLEKDEIQSFDLGSGSLKTAFLASGAVNADALAAGALSAGAGIPVLLSGRDSVDDSTTKAIDDLGIKQLIVLGGTDRISNDVVDGLTADHGVSNVVRVAGSGQYGRYNTAAMLADLGLTAATNGLGLATNGQVYLANGAAGFPDALAVGPLAGLNGSVLLTVPTDVLPDLTSQFLKNHKTALTSVTALGQSDRIADSVVTAAQKAIL